mgnify:FL=1
MFNAMRLFSIFTKFAQSLKPTDPMQNFSERIRSLITDKRTAIAEQVVEEQYKQYPEYWKQFGAEGKRTSIRDAGYHLSFLAEALAVEDPEIFTDYIQWVKQVFRGIGFPDEVMVNTLKWTQEALNNFLPEDLYYTAAEYLDAGIRKMQEPVPEIYSYIDDSGYLGGLARDFNETLLKGDRRKASQMIVDEVQKGTPVRDIYLNIFQKSQLEVGRLWMENRISVAQEHFVSAATQMIMSQLYPHIFTTERKGHTFVGACVGGELHEIGIRMVCDFFEMEGWDTWYLGANTPAYTLLQSAKENKAEILGLSVTMPYYITTLRDVISRIRQDEYGKKLRLLVGGNGINNKTYLWKVLGADGYAPNAQEAIQAADRLVS